MRALAFDASFPAKSNEWRENGRVQIEPVIQENLRPNRPWQEDKLIEFYFPGGEIFNMAIIVVSLFILG